MVGNHQHIIEIIFVSVIAMPLPVMLLYYPISRRVEISRRRKYHRIIQKYFGNNYHLSFDQLKTIFPDKQEGQLMQIANYLAEE